MARKKKRNSEWNPDESVKAFFELTKEHFTSAEFGIIEEGYECLRQVVEESMYSEVAMVLETVVLARRKNDSDSLITLNKVLNDALEDPLIAPNALYNASTVRLRELKGEDASYITCDMCDNSLASEQMEKHLVKSARASK